MNDNINMDSRVEWSMLSMLSFYCTVLSMFMLSFYSTVYVYVVILLYCLCLCCHSSVLSIFMLSDNINIDSRVEWSMNDNINMDSRVEWSMNDNINMDSTVEWSMNDNINMDSTVEFMYINYDKNLSLC
jgi:hypothetical protein